MVVTVHVPMWAQVARKSVERLIFPLLSTCGEKDICFPLEAKVSDAITHNALTINILIILFIGILVVITVSRVFRMKTA